jgi:hypothetical protein
MTSPIPDHESIRAHDLLLRMAGRVADTALAQSRRMLADGAERSAMAFLARELASHPVPLTEPELTAVRSLAGDPSALPGAEPVGELPALPFRFSELDADLDIGRDEIDEAVVAAVLAVGEGVSAVWRSWRYLDAAGLMTGDQAGARGEDDEQVPGSEDEAAQGSTDSGAAHVIAAMPDPSRPYRVYLVEVEEEERTQQVAADLLAAVADAAYVGVEVVPLDAELPPYQEEAIAESLLLWAGVGGAEFLVARSFDFADPDTGPGFEHDHPVIDDLQERGRLIDYLHGGFPILATMAMMDDVVDPEAGPAVPQSFRTDGMWIWSDTVAYYLERHGLAPDEDLTRHIRQQQAAGILVPDPDEETVIRACDFMLNPPPEEALSAAWLADGPE